MPQPLIHTVQMFSDLPCHVLKDFYAPEGTSGGILKSHRLSVRQSVGPSASVTNRVSAIAHKLLKQI